MGHAALAASPGTVGFPRAVVKPGSIAAEQAVAIVAVHGAIEWQLPLCGQEEISPIGYGVVDIRYGRE